MKSLRALWRDESAAILSAEAVLIGTVGVVGATVGLSTLATSIEAELDDVAMSIRSLDQSYRTPTFRSGGASTAGSSFTQLPVEEARAHLRQYAEQRREEASKQLRNGPAERPANMSPATKDVKPGDVQNITNEEVRVSE